MEGDRRHTQLEVLSPERLAEVVERYPWYGAAHMEVCVRMARSGGEALGARAFTDAALFVGDRAWLSALSSGEEVPDYSDRDKDRLLGATLSRGSVRVAGGDYFSQADYDRVRDSVPTPFFAGRGAAPAKGGDDPAQAPSGVAAGSAQDLAEGFATETMARILLEQGQREEARRVYARLALDFPEKKAYFAAILEALDRTT